ncbi:hypothetical protein AAG570_008497 [Ranatra chinensis]|uniref:BTB domain-containing protein n=1 Tax=Ranatra chinensis TaxID=642074 RepID=A0ABD0Z862_9HEMI
MEMHVRWRHHEVGLLGFLRQMLSSEAFVDVTLCCQNRKLNAHRILLSASSPYLQVSYLLFDRNKKVFQCASISSGWMYKNLENLQNPSIINMHIIKQGAIICVA